MSTLKKSEIVNGVVEVNYPPDSTATAKEALAHVSIPGTTSVAVWNGHEFEVIEIHPESGYKFESSNRIQWRFGPRLPHSYELMHIGYWPIDPRIITSDVRGAIRAYPNSDNTGWLFAHTDEGPHHDYELQLLAACDGVFQPYFRQLQVESFSAVLSASNQAKTQFTLFATFYGQVITKVREIARSTFLGEREQQSHPKEGWLDRDLTSAVTHVENKWKETRASDHTSLSIAINYIKRSLTMPSVETRWDRVARLEREASESNEEENSGA